MGQNKIPILVTALLVILASPVILWVFTVVTGIGSHYKAPSESMAPSINVGEHFYVSKVDYKFSKTKTPNRGDVIVFKDPKTNIVMVKRVIALSGDTILTQDGRVVLNEKVVGRKLANSFTYKNNFGSPVSVDEYQELLPNSDKSYYIYEQTDNSLLDNTEVFNVPSGHVFVMGDNRDNSTDSRSVLRPGFIPIENILGEATHIMFQSKKCVVEKNIKCPPKRFMEKI